MKRKFQLLMLVTGLSFFVACGGTQTDTNSETEVTSDANTENTTEEVVEQRQTTPDLVGVWDYLHEGGSYEFKADGTYEAYAEYEDGTKETYGSGTWETKDGKLFLNSGGELMDYPLNFMEGYMLLEEVPADADLAAEGLSSPKEYFMEWGYKKR